MGYHPRAETSNVASFQTTRCRSSELWFVNNEPLEEAILGYLAKYKKRYEVSPYAFAIEGNHQQFPALFPKCNRSHFMRDLNSSVARAVPRFVPSYTGGGLWQRRYSSEYLPGNEDVEEWFFYTVLQAVQDGHVQKLSQYPGYNCFHDAVHGIKRTYKVMNWGAYNEARRWSKKVRQKDFIEEVTLEYTRLPGYEHLSQSEYAELMHEKLEKRRVEIIRKRLEKGLPCHNGEHLRGIEPGARPKSTKSSTSTTHRPRVLSICNERRAACKEWYFKRYFDFMRASHAYRTTDSDVQFPPGMYKPPIFTCHYSVPAGLF
jgi:hypothetical protein